MDGQPKISVVINNYNYADFVGNAIQSVLDQSYEKVECIVVDDGSTDGSRSVIEKFPNISTIFKANGRQTSAMRAGIERATGDIVVLLDADDALFPFACAQIAAAWKPGMALFQYRLEKRNTNGEVLGEYPNDEFWTSGHRASCIRWGHFPSCPTSGNAFALTALKKSFAHISDRDLDFPDGYLILSAALFGDVGILNKPLAVYLVHGKNASTSAVRSGARLKAQLLVNITQKKALASLLTSAGIRRVDGDEFLMPYDWRNMAMILLQDRSEPGLENYSLAQACMRGIRKFLIFPDIPIYRRAKNIVLLSLVLLVPGLMLKAWNRPVQTVPR